MTPIPDGVYRACYADYGQSAICLTLPCESHLSDEDLIEAAVAEAHRAGIVGTVPDEDAGIETEAQLRERLVVGEWKEL